MTKSKEIVWIKIIQKMELSFKDNNLNYSIKLNKFQSTNYLLTNCPKIVLRYFYRQMNSKRTANKPKWSTRKILK